MAAGGRDDEKKEPRTITLLHLDDDLEFLELFRATCSGEFNVLSLPGAEGLFDHLDRGGIDALVLDYDLPGKNGLELLSEIREKHPSMPVIFYTGQGNEEVARGAFKAGATDYFVKHSSDFAQNEKIANAVRKAVKQCAVEAELEEKRVMLEGIVEYNPYAIMIADRLGRPIRINRAHTKMHGVSPGSDGKILFDDEFSIPEEARDAIQKEWERKRHTYSCFNDEGVMINEEYKRLLPLWEKGEVVRFPPTFYHQPFPRKPHL